MVLVQLSGVRLNYLPNLFILNNKTMNFYLLFFYLLSESMASNCSNDSTSYDMSKTIICYYKGDRAKCNPTFDNLDPKDIPCECDLIQFTSFTIDQSSIIHANEELLKAVTHLRKPIILPLNRDETYTGWTAILGPDGNDNDTKILCDFATKYNILGYILFNIQPAYDEAINKNIKKYIVPYIKQLKKMCPPNFIIGVDISVFPDVLKNTDIYNFEALNDLVTFYEINTLALNLCNPKLYNGMTPITKSEPGPNYLYSLEEVVSNLKETKICCKKQVFVIALLTYNITEDSIPAYSKMCMMGFDNSTCCAQTSENYYNKGKYFQELHVGIKIAGLDWDDYLNACECKSAFNGFYNIYAGYRGGSVIPCAKFDVQSIHYPIK